jgi:hypothetical protein
VITFRLKRGRALANSQAGCGRRRVAGMTTLGDPTAWLMMQSITGIFAAITGNFFGITGNLIERAGKALKMHSPLLLSPAIGQRAGELCEGEISRRGAVEQCRHDPG